MRITREKTMPMQTKATRAVEDHAVQQLAHFTINGWFGLLVLMKATHIQEEIIKYNIKDKKPISRIDPAIYLHSQCAKQSFILI